MNINLTHNPFSPRRHPFGKLRAGSEQAKRAKSRPRHYTRGANDSRIGSCRPSLSDNPIRQHAQRVSCL